VGIGGNEPLWWAQMGKQFYKTVVVVWLALSVGSVLLVGTSWTKVPQRIAAVRQVQDIRNSLIDIRRSLNEAESGARGYVISGDRRFLAPLGIAETNIPAQFDELVDRVRDEPVLLQNVTKLRAKTELRLNLLDKTVAARQENAREAANQVSSGEG